ncbi:hypothetical protein PISMIDRAFT_681132 [Pisolithus microcarpus 441]|uniref:Uncharacterized protein n=1 Tax=Pisolithus microcarpus 441 TaxID=765257 RepID=A0A0C9ZG70_9AGAM|nr:hypothetical protein PISMIDRAFT_681132 [Pisolithus microcarpus 441]
MFPLSGFDIWTGNYFECYRAVAVYSDQVPLTFLLLQTGVGKSSLINQVLRTEAAVEYI